MIDIKKSESYSEYEKHAEEYQKKEAADFETIK